MSILRNKHVLIAALIAPVLALIAYFAIDHMFGETPHVAVEGQSYPLAEEPGCRWESGRCGLKNNDFELDLEFERLAGDRLRLDLESVFPLDGVMLAVAMSETDEKPPVAMKAAGADGLRWSLEIRLPQPETDRIRLVASTGGTVYYGDVSAKFTLAGETAD